MRTSIMLRGFGFRWLCLMVMGWTALFASPAQGGPSRSPQDEVVIRWGNQVITKADVDLRIQAMSPAMQEQLKDPAQRRNYLESLIQIKVVGAEARARKIDKIKRVANRISDTTDSILLQEYMNEKIKGLPSPTEAEVKAYYEKHKEEFVTPAYVRARHILIEAKPDAKPEDVARAKAKAERIYAELEAGGDFDKLCAQYSEDKETKDKGGDLGLFQAEQMVPEFSGPVFKMKKGDLSRPFLTPFGFHIVRIDDQIPSRQMELKDVYDEVKSRADNENREKLIYAEFDRLKKKYKAVMIEEKK